MEIASRFGQVECGEVALLRTGQSRPVMASPAELFFHDTGVISADIVDNGENGSVSLVMARPNFRMRLSGNNSYTGGTYIHGDGDDFINGNGTLTIETIEAVPANDRVYVDGGLYELLLPVDAGTVALEELHLRGNGRVTGFNSPIDAREIYLEHGLIDAPLVGDGVIYKDSRENANFLNSESPNFTGQIVVREGTLSLDPGAFPQATYHLEGGQVRFSRFHNVMNEIHLNGGGLLGGYIGGDIFVDAESTLIGARSATVIAGRLIGDADLTIEGGSRDYVELRGDLRSFRGDFDISSGILEIGTPVQMGISAIVVNEGAQLMLRSDRASSPATRINNTIHVHGGTLMGAPPSDFGTDEMPPNFLAGNVFVHDEAFIGAFDQGEVDRTHVPGLTFSGRLTLEDGANVYGLSNSRARFHTGERPLVEVSGELLVGKSTSWNLATASLLVSGSISPTAAQSSIDFQGVESSLVLEDTEIVTVADKNLAITINDGGSELSLQGTKGIISGSGEFSANVKLTDGATISPGNSSGALTIVGDTTIGEGAIYEWEIASINGTPGEAWDLLQVDGNLRFTATGDNPWILQISGLPGFSPGQARTWLIASANNITGFDPTVVRFDTRGIGRLWPSLKPADLILYTQNGDLFVQSIPEPDSWLLAVMGIMVTADQRRRRPC